MARQSSSREATLRLHPSAPTSPSSPPSTQPVDLPDVATSYFDDPTCPGGPPPQAADSQGPSKVAADIVDFSPSTVADSKGPSKVADIFDFSPSKLADSEAPSDYSPSKAADSQDLNAGTADFPPSKAADWKGRPTKVADADFSPSQAADWLGRPLSKEAVSQDPPDPLLTSQPESELFSQDSLETDTNTGAKAATAADGAGLKEPAASLFRAVIEFQTSESQILWLEHVVEAVGALGDVLG